MVLDEHQLAALDEPIEAARERRRRLQSFGALGFDLVEAAALAVSDADLAQAAALIAHGCPAGLAARILL